MQSLSMELFQCSYSDHAQLYSWPMQRKDKTRKASFGAPPDQRPSTLLNASPNPGTLTDLAALLRLPALLVIALPPD
ncbi:hypothetical protein HBI56_003600 [Parastagonospora nodorum]|uniref:Uncharacterized protein n=1 Tax=Phaeosphaeria nodorum (strain SN15 / ATCC MYA-4574 / FGSC 10173) TaxID=321614 RepID=A0A7U2HV08_PHANO|nr:hypothetical protein HBH56_137440 [Parastagonospora nodorum]QRC91334.1 hypothetical protein JI435_426750 [Parastagonospora nodorum SN15]KAH3928082.1 hypothetical protein HBH54_142570 [Parastagonospora nodorum]KAH3972332.1 hypothetical protein HBH52_152660 [Parastagonospora nodorum]KAH3982793.1 hypothetical protein HBH51_035550 [Parastagonospora nodorum]